MRVLTAIIVLLLIFTGCRKDKQPQIPYVNVNLMLYPNTLDNIDIGGYKYIDAGYRGIVIYRLLPDQFAVYERCCPYDPDVTGAKVTVDASGSTCTDPICGSRFILYDGTPFAGPSPYALMQYRWSYDGERLLVYN